MTGKFLLAAIFSLLVHPSLSASGENPLPKTNFELRTGVIVWDVGNTPGFVDSSDDLTDLDEECVIGDSGLVLDPSLVIAHKNLDPNRLSKNANRVLSQVGLAGLDFNMNPVAAFIGRDDEPIFFLFPELHLNSPVKPKRGALHESLAKDMLRMTVALDRQNIKILNTTEGPQGVRSPQLGLTPKTLEERFSEAYKLMAARWINGSQLIGEIYADRVDTHYHDSNDLIIKDALAAKAYVMSFDPEKLSSPWVTAKNHLLSRLPVRASMVKVDDYKEFLERISLLPSEQLKALQSQFCEARSREMARYSYEVAKKSGAKIVYMGFGASHAHGVIKQLQELSASLVVFSPNH